MKWGMGSSPGGQRQQSPGNGGGVSRRQTASWPCALLRGVPASTDLPGHQDTLLRLTPSPLLHLPASPPAAVPPPPASACAPADPPRPALPRPLPLLPLRLLLPAASWPQPVPPLLPVVLPPQARLRLARKWPETCSLELWAASWCRCKNQSSRVRCREAATNCGGVQMEPL